MFDTMHTVASILGKADDAATFASKAAAIKASYNNAFFNAAAGHYVGVNDEGYRQSHNLLSLAFGLTPNSSIQTVADSIAADVANRDMHLNTGALSTKQLLPVLTAHGHGDTAYALITQTTYPSWGFWIENGATSMYICPLETFPLF
jgi:alpha-L-rhamnosidase